MHHQWRRRLGFGVVVLLGADLDAGAALQGREERGRDAAADHPGRAAAAVARQAARARCSAAVAAAGEGRAPRRGWHGHLIRGGRT